jgi:hypothetical protein
MVDLELRGSRGQTYCGREYLLKGNSVTFPLVQREMVRAKFANILAQMSILDLPFFYTLISILGLFLPAEATKTPQTANCWFVVSLCLFTAGFHLHCLGKF